MRHCGRPCRWGSPAGCVWTHLIRHTWRWMCAFLDGEAGVHQIAYTVAGYLDADRQVRIVGDASPWGLGAYLISVGQNRPPPPFGAKKGWVVCTPPCSPEPCPQRSTFQATAPAARRTCFVTIVTSHVGQHAHRSAPHNTCVLCGADRWTRGTSMCHNTWATDGTFATEQ